MTHLNEPEFDPVLIDLALGRLPADEAMAVRQRLAHDAELAQQYRTLEKTFAALNAAAVPITAPPSLAESIAAHVAAARPLRVRHGGVEEENNEAESSGLILRMANLRDVIAVAAMLVLAVGLGIPGLLSVRDRSQRITCSANLAQLGAAVQQYASSYAGALPFASWGKQASWRPTDDPKVTVIPNRQHPYRLVRLHYVDPRFFVCPSQDDRPMPADQVPDRDDFLEARNVSYAYQNMAGVRPTVNDSPDLPLMADENPLFADGVPLADLFRGEFDAALRNSPAHNSRGQNILTVSGHVRWTESPTVGVNGDNIWTIAGETEYTGREGPATKADAHLLK